MKIIPSAWLYRIFAGATTKVEFVNKDIEYLISILYFADTKKLKKYVPVNTVPSQLLPRISTVCIMGVKYRDVDGLGECSDFTVSVFVDYKKHRNVGYFPWFINDNEKIVEIANREWMWPKELGEILWKKDSNSLDLSVSTEGTKLIDISLMSIDTKYEVDQMSLPALLTGEDGYQLSTVVLKRKYTNAEASINVPVSSSMAGFPLSDIFLDVYYAQDSEMNVLAVEPV